MNPPVTPELPPLPKPDVFDPNRFGICWREESVIAYARACLAAPVAPAAAPSVPPLTADMLRYAMAAMGTGSPEDASRFRLFWRFASEAHAAPLEPAPTSGSPIYASREAPADLTDARQTMIDALRASKGWTTGYAAAFVDDFAAAPQAAPADLKMLGFELDGVIHDAERDGFDAVCMETVKRVRAALAAMWALDERMLTLRKCIASAKAEGWQHMAIETLESLTGGAACAKCGLPPGCPDCKAVHDVPEDA